MNDWQHAQQHAQRAHEFYEAGMWDRALDELQRAIELNPYESDWHFGKGLTLEALQRYEEAIACFEQVIDLRGDDIDALMHLAVNLIRGRSFSRAVEMLEQVNEIDRDYEPGYCHRIAAYTGMGEHEKAEQMFYLARLITPECPHCYDHMAQSLLTRNQPARAAWCWQETLKLDPQHARIHANLAHAYWRQGHAERARQAFMRHLRSDPGDIEALMDFGHLLVNLGQHNEASEKFRRVLELSPTCADAHLCLGELALAGDHLDAALAELEAARRLDPMLPMVRLRLAQAAFGRGQQDRARRLARQELRFSHHDAAQTLELARVLIELNLQDPALRRLDALLEAEGYLLAEDELAAGHLYRGVARLVLLDHAAGIRDCRRCLRLDPGNTVAIHNLTLAYLETGALSRAAACLRRTFWLHEDMGLPLRDPQLVAMRRRFRRRLALRWTRRIARRLTTTAGRVTRALADRVSALPLHRRSRPAG